MKASDWTELCEREQASGGEVIAVTLTRQAMQDLAGDILASGGLVTLDKDGNRIEGMPSGACGGRIGSLFNVAAGNREVDFTPLADADTATVRDADGTTRVISLAAA